MSLLDSLKRKAASAAQNAVSNAVTSAANSVSQKKESFKFTALPKTVEELSSLAEASLDSPFKAAALTVCALCTYTENPEEGIKMLNFLKGPQPLSTYELQFLRDRFSDKKYVPFSYFEGSSPENDYTPSTPYSVTVFSNPYSFNEENYAVLHISSSGADSPRQVKLRRKGDGKWFLWEQFLLSDIRAPKSSDPWA